MLKRKRTITSRHVATEKEQKQAASEGSRFLTEKEKDEIEAGPKPEVVIKRTLKKKKEVVL